ncbi:hypothetical protein [Flavobacterium caseinilyticum]|uniref:Uncharacterized protein n=1 Tax=Flavobacterium caseinilyticum TaxID=2541732 RepID=A0A4R5ATM0_9FLAO|nr:hypothetical protein [Flavobacterium caseinilyticum]TDD76351.1 hypothetical protein E0F89_09000 [Flavobacterium caseinilyticum]
MKAKEIEGKNGGAFKKYSDSERNAIDFKYVNIGEVNGASTEASGSAKIRYKKRRKNKSRKFKEYFNIHEKVGQIFIAILIISFLYTLGYFLNDWNTNSL